MRLNKIMNSTGKPHILAFDGYWWRFTFTKCGLYIESEKLSEIGD